MEVNGYHQLFINNILQNILFCIQWKKNTRLEKVEGEWTDRIFIFGWTIPLNVIFRKCTNEYLFFILYIIMLCWLNLHVPSKKACTSIFYFSFIGTANPKIKIVRIYSPLCNSKPVYISFFTKSDILKNQKLLVPIDFNNRERNTMEFNEDHQLLD